MAITAINKRYQANINAAYRAYRKYHDLVNLEDHCETEKQVERLQDKQAKHFDDYQINLGWLPGREQTNFYKQHEAIHGYK